MKNRTRSRLLTIALCGCILMTLSSVLFAGGNKPKKVLVLHSYHRGLSWDDSIDEGIEAVFKESDLSIEAQIEYMDTKRIHNPGYLRQLQSIYKTKFKKCKFDVIISTDNNALNFLLKHHNELFPQTPVVFCGVNNYQDTMLKGRKLFTGTVEAVDMRGTLDTALRLHPETKQIVIYGSNTPTYFANKEHLKNLIPDYKGRADFRFVENLNIEEVMDDIGKLPDNSSIFIISSIMDEQGIPMPFMVFPERMASVSRVPIYSCWDFLLDHGIVGGKLISGFAQGATAARMALRILHGEKTANIPILKESPNRFMFDHNLMTRFGLNPSNLPQGSILINRPSSFYSQYKAVFWGGIISISTLLLFIAMLVINIVRRRRAEEALRRSEKKYRSLTDDVLDNSGVGIFILDSDFRIVWVNQALEGYFGLKRDEIIGKDKRQLIRKRIKDIFENPDGFADKVSSTYDDNTYIECFECHVLPDGERQERWLEHQSYPIQSGLYAGGRIEHYYDITAMKQAQGALRESEDKFRSLADNQHDVVWTVNENLEINYISPSCFKMTGATAEERMGKNPKEFYTEESYKRMMMKLAEERQKPANEMQPAVLEVDQYHKDGHLFPAEITCMPIIID
ncbi:MAG: PAS domain S-box protein, partial [Nitrospina sp.]|nr:PAS domain S-box protein [Nitrospina sp.]